MARSLLDIFYNSGFYVYLTHLESHLKKPFKHPSRFILMIFKKTAIPPTDNKKPKRQTWVFAITLRKGLLKRWFLLGLDLLR